MYFLFFILAVIIIGIAVTNPQLFRSPPSNTKDRLRGLIREKSYEIRRLKDSLNKSQVLLVRTEQDVNKCQTNILDDEKDIEEALARREEDKAREAVRSIKKEEAKLSKYLQELDQVKADHKAILNEIDEIQEEIRVLERKCLALDLKGRVELTDVKRPSIEDELLEAAEEVEVEEKLEEYKAKMKEPWRLEKD